MSPPPPQSAHSARPHALSAALCALLLLVALGIMDATRAPLWALLATQGALLVTTASAGIWLDRALAFGVRRSAFGRGKDDPLWWANLERKQNGSRRRMRAGSTLPGDDDDVFWQERILRGNREEE